jgi:hypothetical protein
MQVELLHMAEAVAPVQKQVLLVMGQPPAAVVVAQVI